jgi:chloramphenicol 3-O phosphotransferase
MAADRQHNTAWPDVIFVNGSSSAGKTTFCRQLQDAMDHPYLVVGFDDFIFMAAPRYFRGADTHRQDELDIFTRDGVEMVRTSRPGEPLRVVARFGPVFRTLIDSMAPAVRALVDAGNAVIFDQALHDEQMAESCRNSLAGLDVFSVGVTCPLPVLEARERERGDRVLGRARGLADVVHTLWAYDVEIDTGSTPPQRCVESVLGALRQRSRPA